MIEIKTQEEIKIMEEGGKIAGGVLKRVLDRARPGVKTLDLDRLGERLILEAGGQPSFKKVPGYNFAICVNINEGVVHGIPGERVIEEGDLVSVDLGVYFKGFHTDVSWTKKVRNTKYEIRNTKFLEAGKEALKKAIEQCQVGKQVGDISWALGETIRKHGYYPAKNLTGHGVGRELHEEPQIPCLGDPHTGPKLRAGMTLAIEVIYTQRETELLTAEDGWGVATEDGSLGAAFEHTVALSPQGPRVLTEDS